MSTPIIFVNPILAQAGAKKTPAPKKTQTTQKAAASKDASSGQIWMFTTGGLFLLLVGLAVYGYLELEKQKKKVKFEQYKSKDIQKKLKLALDTIGKMETNPDLINSREFNLDYLRMRMDEEVFHFAIVNQIKVKVKQLISVALRPNQAEAGAVGIASTSGRQVDETFDLIYETGEGSKRSKRVLFRIQVKLMKLPTQATSVTITQIIDCIETFLSPAEDHDTWQPTIQGRLVKLNWDQKAKPTPLLVLEQMNEGGNVTLKTKRTP
ncbi:hypothetical protein H6F77_21580 [Microcoleus sp. FACHB-831]|nr:hypothetical protein [Microcoleus sp. FACHB-831]MBD1923642.1 hypothetical protein [Microcoleus sp. FACHB-831]